MATKKPLISVVILNWNGIEDTKLCLEYAHKLNYSNYEIIVVDNGSDQTEKDYLSQLKDITYIDNRTNRGFAGGQIDGYKVAKGEYILLLNNDAVIDSGYIKNALPLFEDPRVAVVGGRAYFWNDDEHMLDKTNRFYAYMEVSPTTAETTMLMEDAGVAQEVNSVSGSAVLVRRAAVEKVGYLYEPFFAYYEETDLFARMKRAGYKVLYSPDLHIWHRNGATSGAQGGSSFFFYHIFRNRFIFVIRNFEPHYIRKFLASYYRLGLRSVLQIPRGQVQKRLGIAYAKAMIAMALQLIPILLDRHKLTRQLGKTQYCHQILNEQIKLSIIIDSTKQDAVKRDAIVKKINQDNNPLHEYIIIVRDSADTHIQLGNNVRFVIDKGFFAAHPINLGCIAARMSWMLIAPASQLPDPTICCEKISQAMSMQRHALYIDDASLAITKDYYQKIGGFSKDSKNLKLNLEYAAEYASLEGELGGMRAELKESREKEELRQQIAYDNNLLRARTGGIWRRYLDKHYHVLQFYSLVAWLGSRDISLRLKLARIKNLTTFTLTLKKRKLATELQHIRNELRVHDQRFSGLEIRNKQYQHTLEMATANIDKNISNIPVFIICFERVNALKQLVAWLESVGIKKIIFLDNSSSYKPLLRFYENTPYQVLRLYRNIGHTAPWSLDIIRILVPDQYYVVTDPDVIPTEYCPKDALLHLAKIHQVFPAYQKVGLGLKIDDLPEHYPLHSEVVIWEKQFWKTELRPGVYEAGVDTTFALYKPFTYRYSLHPSLRTGEPYVARHLPWYVDPNYPTKEEIYYRKRANVNITSWNVDELPDRYKQEIQHATK